MKKIVNIKYRKWYCITFLYFFTISCSKNLAKNKIFNSKNFNITVLDKGKYPGGRISTRKNKEFIFNHGAQFFTAKSNEFKKICQLGVKDNVLINWNTLSKKDRFIGNPDMREFSYWFSKNLEIYQETLVESIEYNDIDLLLLLIIKNLLQMG